MVSYGKPVGGCGNAVAYECTNRDTKLLLVRDSTVKACETVQSYPERLLQGFPGHIHPDHPSYLQLPIYSHLRVVGAEVAFPKEAPTLFQPRIYDGNILVDRKSSASKIPVFERIAEILQGLTGNPRLVSSEPVAGGPQNASPATTETPIITEAQLADGRAAAGAPVSAGVETTRTREETSEMPSGEPPGPTEEAWKKRMYRTWHSLWILNLLAYDASDIWAWLQHHNARSFAFPPWKVTHVGVLRTAEAGEHCGLENVFTARRLADV